MAGREFAVGRSGGAQRAGLQGGCAFHLGLKKILTHARAERQAESEKIFS
jgi:hypothetical protein